MQNTPTQETLAPRQEGRFRPNANNNNKLPKNLVKEFSKSANGSRPSQAPPMMPDPGDPNEAEELNKVEEWLDWGIEQAEEWGPTVLELLPELAMLLLL